MNKEKFSKRIKQALAMFGVFVLGFTTVTQGQTFQTASAQESDNSPTLTVKVEGEGSVKLSDDSETYSVDESNEFSGQFSDGTSLTFDISSDNTIESITENDTEYSSIADENYADEKEYQMTYTTKDEDATIVVKFNDSTDATVDEETSTEDSSEEELELTEESNETRDTVSTSKWSLVDESTAVVKYLFANYQTINDGDTVTSVVNSEDKNSKLYSQIEESAQVYMADDGTYKIVADTPFVNGFATSSYAYGWDCARGNDDGEKITKGVSYDKKTGVFTVQPEVFEEVHKKQNKEGDDNKDFSDIQLQLLVPVDIQKGATINVNIQDDENLINSPIDSTVSVRPFMTTRIQLATKKTAGNITQKNIQIYVNGREEALDSDMYAYDPESGVLAIKGEGASFKQLDIVLTKNKRGLFERASAANGVATSNVKVYALNVLAYLADGEDCFNVGDSIDFYCKFGSTAYGEDLALDTSNALFQRSKTMNAASVYTMIDYPNGDGGEATATMSALGVPTTISIGGSTIDFRLRDANGNAYASWTANMAGISDPIEFNSPIKVFCHHIKTALPGKYTTRHIPCTLRVIDKAVDGNGLTHVVLCIETNNYMFGGPTPQTVGTTFEIAYNANTKGTVKLKKTSANTSITDGNSCYSLEGAVYEVFTDSNCSTNPVATLKTNAKGETDEVELKKGTYYVKEKTAPKGYAIDETVHKVEVKTKETATIDVKDVPQSDPIDVVVGKVDAYTNENKPQGSASLAGAEFTIKYYNVSSNTDPANQGIKPTAQWVIKTNESGLAYLNAKYLVSGSAFYYKADGTLTIPLGTITVQETKAPEGYKVDSTVQVRQVSSDGIKETDVVYNQPTVKEEAIYGAFEITKFKSDDESSSASVAEVGAKFVAVLEKYYNEAGGDATKALELAKANGTDKEYSEMTTDNEGLAKSSQLVYGTYYVCQTATGTNATETKLANPFKFVVSSQNGNAYVYGQLDETTQISASSDGKVHFLVNNIPMKSGVKIIKQDSDGNAVTLNNAAFKIKKINSDGSVVKNYSKKSVKTDENGDIQLKVGTKWYDTFVTNADNRLSVLDNVANLFGGTTYEAEAGEEKGSVSLPVSLPSGDYQLQETNAPKGFLLTNDGKFTISATNITGYDDDGEPLLTIVVKNEKPEAEITLTKTFDEPNDRKHGDVQFKLVATQDILNATDGSYLYHKDEVVGIYTLGANDKITIKHLPLGTGESAFKLVEVSTYENYVLDATEHEIVFKQEDQKKTSYSYELTVNNKAIKIGTTAKSENGTHMQQIGEKVTITDTVSYEGLQVGRKYKVTGRLMDKETNKVLVDADGKEVTSETKTFTATSQSGTVDVTFTFNASELGGKDVVAFEKLLNMDCTVVSSGDEVAKHEDIDDEGQTIHFIDLHTTAMNPENWTDGDETKTAVPDDTESGTTYSNIKDNTIYHDGQAYIINKDMIDTYKIDEAFKYYDASDDSERSDDDKLIVVDYEAKTVVVSSDEDSTLTFDEFFENIKDATYEVDGYKSGKQFDAAKQITVVDKVQYSNLVAGKKYRLHGVVVSKETGEAVKVNDKAVETDLEFTPEESDGYVEVKLTFDAETLADQDCVVYETLYVEDGDEEIEIGKHEDKDDYGQSFHINKQEIRTTATVNGNKEVTAGKITLTDKVEYSGLVPGEIYTISGKLMDKATGQPIKVDGKEVTAFAKFKAQKNDGSVDVVFNFDASDLGGKTVVVFETCTHTSTYDDSEKEIAKHEDINDEGQSVKINKAPETGVLDDSNNTLWFASSLVCLLCIGFLFCIKKRRA